MEGNGVEEITNRYRKYIKVDVISGKEMFLDLLLLLLLFPQTVERSRILLRSVLKQQRGAGGKGMSSLHRRSIWRHSANMPW
jgi:hypothetical protein